MVTLSFCRRIALRQPRGTRVCSSDCVRPGQYRSWWKKDRDSVSGIMQLIQETLWSAVECLLRWHSDYESLLQYCKHVHANNINMHMHMIACLVIHTFQYAWYDLWFLIYCNIYCWHWWTVTNDHDDSKRLRWLFPDHLRRGFLRLVQLVLKTAPEGLIHCGPPCSSWVWVNRATSRRSRESPEGDGGVASVAPANTILGHKSSLD